MEAYGQVIIIGAARSGTNILRDVLTSFSGVETWPCDEIPYIWKYGNAKLDHDQLTPAMARPSVRNYIRASFEEIAKKSRASIIVEKTCANSLRVGFVNEILPEARFVYIMRDGVDVIASAMKRWVAPLDLIYVLRKARFVPLTDLPYYGIRFALNRISKLCSRESRLKSWGPRFKGMGEMVESLSLQEVCAHQWVRSVEESDRQLASVEQKRVHSVKYEDFVSKPRERLAEIAAFCGIEAKNSEVAGAAGQVFDVSVGKGRMKLSQADLERISPLVNEMLLSHGYPEIEA